eukprot:COSAG04_NODE_10870_length_747_cov_1.271605_1_plen_66_part_00
MPALATFRVTPRNPSCGHWEAVFRRGIRMDLFPSAADPPPQEGEHTHTAALLHGFAQEGTQRTRR